ncbi:Endoribonuclease Dicer [Bulinus truncatus]|nr:Endoribonuclease Dicer [Bulinus truncatus]
MAYCYSSAPRKGSRYHRLDDIPTDTFTPRTYQIQLLDSALKRNSLLCLGCSESKFFLALMLAKELSSVTRLPLLMGGKRTFFLTDSEDDVDYLCQTLPNHTDLLVGSYSSIEDSEKSPKEEKSLIDWHSLMDSNNILVCQGSAFLAALQNDYVHLKEVNLIVFDNCHRAVEVENHPYAEIVKGIKSLPMSDQPHILGVTAAIAATDCSDPLKLKETISLMEEAMFAYAETSMLILSERFGCRPKECIIRCSDNDLFEDHTSLNEQLEDILEQCYFFFSDCCIAVDDTVDHRDPCETPLQVLSQCLNILNILGSWCTSSVSEYFMMQLEKIIKFEKNDIHKKFLRCVITTLRYFVKVFDMNFHPNYDVNELLEYTTPKVRELVTVLRRYKPEMDFIIVSNSDGYNDDDEFSDITDDDDSIMSGSDDEDSSGEGFSNGTSKPLHIAVKRTADGGHERIMTFSEEEEKNLCGIVFVENRYIAFGLNKIIEEVCSWDENLCFVKSCHITGQGLRGTNGKQKVNKAYKRQEEALRKFRTQECNLVIATLELEEGIDIPKCNLVVRFDPPKDFRAYALSKGRARAREAVYVILLDNDNFEGFNSSLRVFKGIEQVLLGENRSLLSQEYLGIEDNENGSDVLEQHLSPYYTMLNNPNSPHVTMQGAIALINRKFIVPNSQVMLLHILHPSVALKQFHPVETAVGPEMKTKQLAKMAVALKMCEMLHKKGELDENLVPVGKEMFLYEEEEEWLNEEDLAGQARPGTTKRKQYYIKKTAEVLLGCSPLPGKSSHLYLVNLKLTGPITDEQNTRGRVIYAPEDTVQTLGILMSKKIPLMPYFPVYTRSGEVTASIDLLQDNIVCSEEEITQLSKFHHFIFSGVLHLEKDPMEFNPVNAECGYLIVPLNGKSHTHLEIDWSFVNKDQPQHFYVAEIRHDLNPVSPFPHQNFIKHSRYMNQKGVALPTSSAETKRARRENLQQKQILVPELCDVHVFPASLWRKTVCLPAILYRANYLLLAEELRHKISKETGIGLEDLPEGFRFPKLDFGFDTSPEKLLDSDATNKKLCSYSKIKRFDENAEVRNEKSEHILGNIVDEQINPSEISQPNDEYISYDNKTELSSDSDSGVASSASSDKSASKFKSCSAHNVPPSSVITHPDSLADENSAFNVFDNRMVSTNIRNQFNNSAKEHSSIPAAHQLENDGSTPTTSVINLCHHAPVTTCVSTVSAVISSPSILSNSSVNALFENDTYVNTFDSSADSAHDILTTAVAAETSTSGASCHSGANNATFLSCSTVTTPLICASSSLSPSSSVTLSSCGKCNHELIDGMVSSPSLKKERETYSGGKTDSSSSPVHFDYTVDKVVSIEKDISNSKDEFNTSGCEPNIGPNAADIALYSAHDSISDTITTIPLQFSHCQPNLPVAQPSVSNDSHPHLLNVTHEGEYVKNKSLLNGHVKHAVIIEDIAVSDGPSIVMNTLSEELSGLDIDLIMPQTNSSNPFHSFHSTPHEPDQNASFQNGKKNNSSSWQQAWLNELETNLFEDERKSDEECQWNCEKNSVKEEEMNSKNSSEDIKLADSKVIKFSFETSEVKPAQDTTNKSTTDMNKKEENKEENIAPSHTVLEEVSANIVNFKIDFWNTDDRNGKHLKEKSHSKIYDKLFDRNDQLNLVHIYSKEVLKESHDIQIGPEQKAQQDDIVVSVNLDEDRELSTFVGPSPCLIMQALTMSNANDFFSLERLETIGDSFLKYAITVYLYCSYPGIHEGKLSYLRSKQVSNYNLYRLGRRKGLAECMVSTKFEPYENWLPPGYIINDDKRRGPVPKVVIVTPGSKVTNSVRNFYLDEADAAKRDEAVQFNRELEWIQQSQEADQQDEVQQEPSDTLIPYSLQCHHGLPDKSVADSVEALIGCYLTTCGRNAALIFMSWLGLRVLPKKKKLKDDSSCLLECNTSSFCKLSEFEFDELHCPPSPLFSNTEENQAKLKHLLQGFDSLEEKICYKFRDKSYLLQAFTHASYHYNTITDCYQRVEFLGDAILDYVITRHLYEDSQKYSPGILTDLRSALVNNNIFAALAVKWGFHKYFKAISPSLFQVIDKFVKRLKDKKEDDIDIDEEFRELSLEECEPEEGAEDDDEEEEVEMEIPKALGDIFESVAGAIYLDSGMSLDAVWRVYYRMMKPHIDKYLKSIPKSPVRELLETEPETAKFERPERTMNGKVRVTVNVVGKGVFSGVGRNYRIAKSAAAKKALRSIRTITQNLMG